MPRIQMLCVYVPPQKRKGLTLFYKTSNLKLLFLSVFFLVSTNTKAHHDVLADIDLGAPIELVGQVAGVEWENPHAVLHIEIQRATGPNQLWLVQLDSPHDLLGQLFTRNTINNLNWVAVVMYLSLSNSCEDECFGYGLSLTDPMGNSYTLSREIASALTELKFGN